MRPITIALCALMVGVASSRAGETKLDIGFGYVDQDYRSNSGGAGFNPKGYFVTVGWITPMRMFVRLDTSITRDQGDLTLQSGAGVETALVEDVKFDLTEAHAAYLYRF